MQLVTLVLALFLLHLLSIDPEMGRQGARRMQDLKRKSARRGEEKAARVVDRRRILKTGLLNVNGWKQGKDEDICQTIVSENLDVVGLLETKLRLEDRKKIEVAGYKAFETRRCDADVDKPGGGLCMLVRDTQDLIFRAFKPKIADPKLQFVEKERLWVTYESQHGKTALGLVYLGFQAGDDRHALWNLDILNILENEIFALRGMGYRVILHGDFNSHIGSDLARGGIPGNHTLRPNRNGIKFLDFLSGNRLTNINAATRTPGDWSTRYCSGMWTRHGSDYTSSTIIDYILIGEEHISTVVDMVVDDKGRLGGGSDHNWVITRFKDRFVVSHNISKFKKFSGWKISEDTDWNAYREMVSSRLSGTVMEDGGVELLSSTLSKAALHGLDKVVGRRIPTGPVTQSKLPKDLVLLIRQKKACEQAWKTEKSLFASSRSDTPPPSLMVSYDMLVDKEVEVRQALESFSRQKRKPLLGLMKSKSRRGVKMFWRQVSSKAKSSSEIKSLQRKSDGVLLSSPEDLAEEAYLYLNDIFDGVAGVQDQHDRQYGQARVVVPRLVPADQLQPRLITSDSSELPSKDPRGFLDKDFSMSEMKLVLSTMGNGKAAGWDTIPNEALKEAPQDFLKLLLVLFNRVKNKGVIPDAWRRGRLCLIHKKGPMTDVSNYRPLTVITSFSSLYTKMLNSRMTRVVEDHGLLGEVQNGFRKGRSTSDCTFILNTILAKCSAKRQRVHLAFLDLQKAYDTVDRGLLWAKLKGLGFGGKFLASIQSFYCGDFVAASVAGVSTKEVFLGRGVRQGCSMSPLLFALYLSTMGHDLSRSSQGFLINGRVTISALFFADDIVLISRTAAGLKELLELVHRHCGYLKMKLSVTKSKVLSGSMETWELFDDGEVIGVLDKVLSFKYLGVDCELSPFRGAVAFQKRALRLANQYRAACIRIARDGSDVTDVAMALWQNVALPTILYGCESIPFTSSTLDALERYQTCVGKFALGLPVSAPNAAVRTILGLRSVREVVYERQLNFVVRVRDQRPGRWSHEAFMDQLGDWNSPFLDNYINIKKEVGLLSSPVSSRHVRIILDDFFTRGLDKSLQDLGLRGLQGVDKLRRFRHVQECEASQVASSKLPCCLKCLSLYCFFCPCFCPCPSPCSSPCPGPCFGLGPCTSLGLSPCPFLFNGLANL